MPWDCIHFPCGHPSSMSICHLPGSSQTLLLRVFHRHDWRLGVGDESSSSLIRWLVPLATSPRSSKSYLMSINSDVVERGLLGITKYSPLTPSFRKLQGFWELCDRNWVCRPNIYFLLYHNITVHPLVFEHKCITVKSWQKSKDTGTLVKSILSLMIIQPIILLYENVSQREATQICRLSFNLVSFQIRYGLRNECSSLLLSLNISKRILYSRDCPLQHYGPDKFCFEQLSCVL